MSTNLIICSVIFILLVIGFIFFLIKKDKLSIKYSMVWLILFFILLISVLVPNFMIWLTHLFGFVTPSNMILTIIIGLLILISIVLTAIVTNQDKKIRLLIQEISLLKGKNK